jgi:hypothetical protein
VTTREELADLIREQITHDTSNRWTMNLVDAILARWRLVPVEEAKRIDRKLRERQKLMDDTRDYRMAIKPRKAKLDIAAQYRAADELTHHDQTAGHYSD